MATVSVHSGDPTTHDVELISLWNQTLQTQFNNWNQASTTISQPLGPYTLTNHCWAQNHGAMLYLRCTRKKAGELTLRFSVQPTQPGGVSITESLLVLKDSPEDLPSADSASFTYTETGGNRYRKVSLKGRPLPDGKPQTKEETDVEDENAYVDALNLNLAYDTTDIFVPLVGDRSLSVRRQHVQELWSNRPGMSLDKDLRFSSLERPFGVGWRTGLAANVRFSTALTKQGGVTVNDGPTMVYVTDEQGATHRFAQIWADVDGNPGQKTVSFIPLPSQATDQDSFLTTLSRVDTLGAPVSTPVSVTSPNVDHNWRLKFTRKFGTTIFFEPVNLGSYSTPDGQASVQNVITTSSGGNPVRRDAYFRVRGRGVNNDYGIEDTSRNRLYYTYGATSKALVPSEISPDITPGRRLIITPGTINVGTGGVADICIESIEFKSSSPSISLKWKYLYQLKSPGGMLGATSQDFVELLAVQGPNSSGGYGNVQKGYSYDFAQELSELPLDAGAPALYHYTLHLKSLFDGGGNRHVFDCGPDYSRKIKKNGCDRLVMFGVWKKQCRNGLRRWFFQKPWRSMRVQN